MNNPDVRASAISFEVIVVGGGAAGMMAAATAASRGLRVVLLEKNRRVGKKLAITGGGRCNITNNKPKVREMLSQYKKEGKFLFSTFTQHGVAESIDWFTERGVALKEENEGRLFPVTDSAETVRQALENELIKSRVIIKYNEHVSDISYNQSTKKFIVTSNQGRVEAGSCILATGGIARPETGSTGEGFAWLQKLGHTVVANSNALVPITLMTNWTKDLSGLTLPDVKLTVSAYGKKQFSRTGKMLFTHVGVSGPLVLNMSKEVGDLLEHTAVTLYLDLFPQHDAGQLKEQLQMLLASNKKIINVLTEMMPRQLAKAILNELALDGETPCHSVRSEDRKKLRSYLKQIPLSVKGLLGADKAVISSGGVVLEEIDFRTMESKLIPHLHIVGDLLNINRPSGGYSLQLCWSTGYVAGKHA
jgi:predicted Rossmann fold flavoprotein